ncbi:MAG: pyridoxamine 5'-phosphate oxidase family protein [Nitriliruptorales bacterium]
MPGYGILGPTEGRGLLPWSWAVQRLSASHDYWLATRWPDGRPHLMPVWGVWHGGALWFSSSRQSRKARNLDSDPRCTVATDNALEPVVVEGLAELVTELEAIRGFLEAVNRKYSTDYDLEFFDPQRNASFQVRPTWVLGLTEDDFAGSPTRWTFQR